MCSLFGLIDYEKRLTTRQRNKILNTLAKECEVRGTDATGIAYNFADGCASSSARCQPASCACACRAM